MILTLNHKTIGKTILRDGVMSYNTLGTSLDFPSFKSPLQRRKMEGNSFEGQSHPFTLLTLSTKERERTEGETSVSVTLE